MDPTLHQKQGINHLNRVLDYAAFVADAGKAQVHLTQEDWWVVADTLFKMETPKELLPDAIEHYGLKNENRTIELKTSDYVIDVDIM